MNRSRITAAAIIVSLIGLGLSAAPANALPSVASSSSSGPAVCAVNLGAATRGADAAKLPAAAVAALAAANEKSPSQFAGMLADSTFWLDRCGRGYFVEPTAPDAGSTSTASPAGAALAGISAADAFTLHSRPGAQRTIYLDFNGADIANTAWNGYTGVSSWTAPGYSIDGDASTYTQQELDTIADIWARISEDYAAFNIDVTTQEPAPDVITRSSSSDQVYGTRVLISPDQNIYSACGCGGVAYVGVFDSTSSHSYYQPAWVSTRGVGNGAKNITEAASHEVGHNLGLSHDGTSSVGYYSGANGWAPIMGVGYYQALAQWSNGAYPNANNTEDDFAVMQANGGPLLTDEDGNTAGSARTLGVGSQASGTITSASDVDYFTVTPSVTGGYQIAALPAAVSPDLDVQLRITELNSGTEIALVNPSFTATSSDSSTGLDATTTVTLTAGTSYLFAIDGVGSGDPLNGGYTDYGSVGNYTLSVAPAGSPLITTSATLPQGLTVSAYSFTFAATSGTSPYTWSATGLPGSLSLSSSGVLSGTVATAGTYSFSVTVTDAASQSSSQTVSLTVVAPPPLVIATTTLANGVTTSAYSATLSATGGIAPYAWSATGLPTGLTLSSGGVLSGTVTTAGTYSFTVAVTDAVAQRSTRVLSLTVAPPPLAITTTSLPNAMRSKTYSATLRATGGKPGYTWSIASGSLPAGLILTASTGVISGKATAAKGTYSFTVRVTDSLGATRTATFSIRVQ
ncbi:MAG: putative Ig domain-containing protein [Agromyces sp.]